MINLKSDDINEITGAQIRAARAVLRWSARDLAAQASIGIATISRAEAEDGVPSTTPANLKAIRRAFEEMGIRFTEDPDGQVGLSFGDITRRSADQNSREA